MAKTRKVRLLFADGTSGMFKIAYNLEQCLIAQRVGSPKLLIINKAFISSKG